MKVEQTLKPEAAQFPHWEGESGPKRRLSTNVRIASGSQQLGASMGGARSGLGVVCFDITCRTCTTSSARNRKVAMCVCGPNGERLPGPSVRPVCTFYWGALSPVFGQVFHKSMPRLAPLELVRKLLSFLARDLPL